MVQVMCVCVWCGMQGVIAYLWRKAPGLDSLVCVIRLSLFLSSCIPRLHVFQISDCSIQFPDGFVYICVYVFFPPLFAFEISVCMCVCVFSRRIKAFTLHVNMQVRSLDDTVNLPAKHASYFLFFFSCTYSLWAYLLQYCKIYCSVF